MTRYISILRGINVAGNRKILMADLKSLYGKLGFSNVVTYIKSGNGIFDSAEELPNADTGQKIEQAIRETFKFDVPVIIRTVDEIGKSILHNPFLKGNNHDKEGLHLTFLKEPPALDKLEKLKNIEFLPDKYQIIGSDAFICCSGKYSDSKLTNQFFESKLGTSATTRNWKTVTRLYEMAMSE